MKIFFPLWIRKKYILLPAYQKGFRGRRGRCICGTGDSRATTRLCEPGGRVGGCCCDFGLSAVISLNYV